MKDMKSRFLSQEGLKATACITMLLDHIGAVFVPGYYTYYGLRILGRIAFPIYCFLLAEGAHYTRDPHCYALRLGLGAILAEIPFDLAFYGRFTWDHQSVMVTLLVGYGVVLLWKKLPTVLHLPVLAVAALAAEAANTDYGGWGVVLIAVFSMVRGQKHADGKRLMWLTLICLAMDSARVPFLFGVPIELFGVLAMIPICLYSGRKTTGSKALSILFYSFYPVHLLVLWYLSRVI